MNGVLLIDKPPGPTSFDVVRAVRRAAGQRKVGHAGTLDPLASGLLVVCLGQGTKLVPYLMEGYKSYSATVRLGFATDTDDALGKPTAEAPVPELNEQDIAATLDRFRGSIEQVPPVFSALKSGGESLHRKARRGEQVHPEPRTITIHELELTGFEATEIDLEIRCSKGTYIRSLARDLGRALDTRAHLGALRRTASSGFEIEDALPLSALAEVAESGDLQRRIIALEHALPAVPSVTLTAAELPLVLNGGPVPSTDRVDSRGDAADSPVCLIDPGGQLVAIARHEDERLQPIRVFPPD
ncbi:MAG: tRNA pseudouridine(55) synthase TruB [Deltaproteobacteria bacterium]|nr:tRNA pseudouridine(55) synthase TruB [Deltaproteobacteria bacterium]